MKRMKRSMLLMVVLFLGLTAFLTGCSNASSTEKREVKDIDLNEEGLPIVDEKVTLYFTAPKSPLAPGFEEMTIFKELEKETNVEISWDNYPDEGYQEKKNLLLASGDLPDAFYNSGFSDLDLMKYGKRGTIVPLEDLIEEHMPNLSKRLEERPALKKTITAPDGHIYSLPRAEEMGLVEMPNIQYINKTWLDKFGLDVPTTLEEYHDALKTFVEEDANGNGKKDEIGLTFMYHGWSGNLGDLIALFGVPDNNEHRIVKDGEVLFSAAQPEFKEAIEYYHGWVKEGLIDKEATTHDMAKLFSKGKTDDMTIGSFLWWEDTELVGTDRVDNYVVMPPLEGPAGKIVGKSNYSEYHRDAFVMTEVNPYPELTARYMDQFYAPKMSAQVNWGPLGEVYEEDSNGMLVNKELPEGVPMGEFRPKVAPGGPFVVLEEDFGTVVDMEPRAKERLAILEEHYKPHMVEESYPKVFFEEEELERINQLEVNIMEFVNQKKAQWLMEGGIEEEWDAYIKQLEEMGLPELMDIYQKGYDDFKE
nr:ABC transporter substrate-binding protein [Halobacillus sp. KGW1]